MHAALVARAWILHARDVSALGTHTPHAARCRPHPCIFMHAAFSQSEVCWKFRGHTCPFLPTLTSWHWGHTHAPLCHYYSCIYMHDMKNSWNLWGHTCPIGSLILLTVLTLCACRGDFCLRVNPRPLVAGVVLSARLLCLVCFRSFRSFAVSRAGTVRVLCEV